MMLPYDSLQVLLAACSDPQMPANVRNEARIMQAWLIAEPSSNTGLCCPECDRKLPRLDIQTSADGNHLLVNVSTKIELSQAAKEVKGLCSLIKQMAGV